MNSQVQRITSSLIGRNPRRKESPRLHRWAVMTLLACSPRQPSSMTFMFRPKTNTGKPKDTLIMSKIQTKSKSSIRKFARWLSSSDARDRLIMKLRTMRIFKPTQAVLVPSSIMFNRSSLIQMERQLRANTICRCLATTLWSLRISTP